MEKQELHNVLTSLPPGPWHARGNTVFAGDQTVCVVFARNSSFTANQIAKLPERLTALFDTDDGIAARVAELEAKIEALEDERDGLKVDLEDAQSRISDLREDLDDAESTIIQMSRK